MTDRSSGPVPALHDDPLDASSRETPIQRALREETARLPGHGMRTSPESGRFLQWLAGLIGARRCLEVGTFTGYATLSLAMALPEDGIVTTCEENPAWTDIAWRYWRQAGVAHKVFLRLAPAAETLDALLAVDQADRYDLASIHAGAPDALDHYERALLLVRRGGVIVVDDTLRPLPRHDAVDDGSAATALRTFRHHLRGDMRVDLLTLPLGGGLTVLRRR